MVSRGAVFKNDTVWNKGGGCVSFDKFDNLPWNILCEVSYRAFCRAWRLYHGIRVKD